MALYRAAFWTKNPCTTKNIPLAPKGLILHSVGCSQPSAQVFVNNWNRSNIQKAVHGFIDANTGVFWQTLPFNVKGWHCGGTGNSTHIGVEMCEPACIKYTTGARFTCSDYDTARACVKRTYDNAVQLYAELCEKYNLSPATILSHKEAHAKGIASNHGDPEHLWNGLGMSYTMDGFRQDVGKIIKRGTQPVTEPQENFKVRVSIDDLNIRKGPGTNYEIVRVCPPGSYTIVLTQTGKGSKAGWGLLKSYSTNKNGWISLDFAKKV